MLIEALKPLAIRLPSGILNLDPGQQVDLPSDQAQRLLEKVPGRVRLVIPPLDGLLCRGCGRAVSRLFNLGVGTWFCIDCIESRPPVQEPLPL